MENEINLTEKDRLFLSNQYLILDKLYPGDGYDKLRLIAESGYINHYGDLFRSIYKELAVKDARFVLDVLDMYRSIIFSYIELKKSGAIKELKDSDVNFPGFDGNDDLEARMLGYTAFFIEDMHRYEEIKERNHTNFNSHRSVYSEYKAKLSKWKDIVGDPVHSQLLSEGDIKNILNTY